MTRVVAVVQARIASTRLPGKVLMPAAGATLLERMLERLASAGTLSEVVVATTTQREDALTAEIAREAGFRVERGHPTNLLDRHVAAARAAGAEVVVKIPSDCPLIDPAAIDRVVSAFLADQQALDFVSNLHPATWPDGNDVEVMHLEALETAWREARRPLELEHTTPFLWDQPERFRVGNVRWETGLDCSRSHRLVLDYPEDFQLIRAVYEALWSRSRVFTLADILSFLDRNPKVAELNARHRGVSWYRHHPGQLKTLEEPLGA